VANSDVVGRKRRMMSMLGVVAYLLGVVLFGIVLHLDLNRRDRDSGPISNSSLGYGIDTSNSKIKCTRFTWCNLPTETKKKIKYVEIIESDEDKE